MNRRTLIALAAAALITGGCASHPEQTPMTQAQAQQQLQSIAADPKMPTSARAAAQQGVDEGQAQNMLEQQSQKAETAPVNGPALANGK